MNWKGYGRKLSWLNLKYCTGIFLQGVRKTPKPRAALPVSGSHYSDRLWTGPLGEITGAGMFLFPITSTPRPLSSTYRGVFHWSGNVTPCLQLLPRLRMRGSIPPSPYVFTELFGWVVNTSGSYSGGYRFNLGPETGYPDTFFAVFPSLSG
jgi:hypothetical protein